ncbi:uncharacterized protein N7511_009848 [Penicillium nucicola]|uniref:uncharacterized protein n=1 Tax=Penicillium nucicola TaxID=1850975 RepID=UPI0025456DE1|nr:uncharacterized protein N7511_009848 [Penicillium nucicola]KAJ5748152.1 hypothetical protein N7511_009848 [Penicillium nucicola]
MRVSATFIDLPAPDIHPGVPKNVLEGQIFNHEDVAVETAPPSLPWERLATGNITLSEKEVPSPSLQVVPQHHNPSNGDGLGLDGQMENVVATPSSNRTRSGRSVQKPTPHTVEKTATKQYSTSAKSSTKKRQRTKSQVNILCIKCNRGNSPSNNLIVLCDECDTPWHQKCHDPKIGNEVIETLEAEWACSECRPEQRSAKRQKQTSARGRKPATKRSPRTTSGVQTPFRSHNPLEQQPLVMPTAGAIRAKSRVGGEALSEQERRTYLTSLSHVELVELLLDVSNNFPRFPMFPSYPQEGYRESGEPSRPATAPEAPSTTTKASPNNEDRAVSVTFGTPNSDKISRLSPRPTHTTPGRRTRSTTASPDISSDSTLKALKAAKAARLYPSRNFDHGPEAPRLSASLFREAEFTRSPFKSPSPRVLLALDPTYKDDPRSTPAGEETEFQLHTPQMVQAKRLMRPPSPVSFSENESENDSEDYRSYADAGEGFCASLDANDRDIMAEAENYPTFSHQIGGKFGQAKSLTKA